jgi:hypothetical protein
MKKSKILFSLIGVLAILGLSSPAHSLMLDFQKSVGGVTQPGYQTVWYNGQPLGSGVTVYANGIWFNRNNLVNAGSLTTAALLNDMNTKSNTATDPFATLYLTFTGLSANTTYDVRFFSSDYFSGYVGTWAQEVTTTFSVNPLYGTGTDVSITYNRTVAPTTDLERSALGQFTSNDDGYLGFILRTTSDDTVAYTNIFTNLNAVEINAADPVPEPATMLLLGSGLIGVGAFVRRKFKK